VHITFRIFDFELLVLAARIFTFRISRLCISHWMKNVEWEALRIWHWRKCSKRTTTVKTVSNMRMNEITKSGASVVEICTIMEYHAVYSCNSLLTFRYILTVPIQGSRYPGRKCSSWISWPFKKGGRDKLSRNVGKYRLRNNPEGRRFRFLRGRSLKSRILQYLSFSPIITVAIKLRIVRWMGHVLRLVDEKCLGLKFSLSH
jgi:hypothetical protein